MAIILLTLLVILSCLLGLSWLAGSDAPFVATQDRIAKKILSQIGLKKGGVFYELGSGDGRIVFEAARLGTKAIGIEQSWIRVWYSRLIAKRSCFKNTFFIHGNIFDRNYFPADYVYIFLLPSAVTRLETKLQKELKKGAIVITQTFHFPNWKPYKKIDLTEDEASSSPKKKTRLGENKFAGDFYLYRVT